MAAIAMKTTMNMDNTEAVKGTSMLEKIKNYLLDNSTYLAAGSAMACGNTYAAAQIMMDSRR